MPGVPALWAGKAAEPHVQHGGNNGAYLTAAIALKQLIHITDLE